MASKQKHDLGTQKMKKNAKNNPAKLSREQKVARRTVDHSRDYVTSIEIDKRNGLTYMLPRSTTRDLK